MNKYIKVYIYIFQSTCFLISFAGVYEVLPFTHPFPWMLFPVDRENTHGDSTINILRPERKYCDSVADVLKFIDREIHAVDLIVF